MYMYMIWIISLIPFLISILTLEPLDRHFLLSSNRTAQRCHFLIIDRIDICSIPQQKFHKLDIAITGGHMHTGIGDVGGSMPNIATVL